MQITYEKSELHFFFKHLEEIIEKGTGSKFYSSLTKSSSEED